MKEMHLKSLDKYFHMGIPRKIDYHYYDHNTTQIQIFELLLTAVYFLILILVKRIILMKFFIYMNI